MVAEAKGARDSAAGTQCVAPHNCEREVQGQKVILGDLSPSCPIFGAIGFQPYHVEVKGPQATPTPLLAFFRESSQTLLKETPGRVLSPEERPGDQSRLRGKMASSQGRGRRRWLRDQIVSWGTSCCVAAACLHETTSQTSPTSVSYFFLQPGFEPQSLRMSICGIRVSH